MVIIQVVCSLANASPTNQALMSSAPQVGNAMRSDCYHEHGIDSCSLRFPYSGDGMRLTTALGHVVYMACINAWRGFLPKSLLLSCCLSRVTAVIAPHIKLTVLSTCHALCRDCERSSHWLSRCDQSPTSSDGASSGLLAPSTMCSRIWR